VEPVDFNLFEPLNWILGREWLLNDDDIAAEAISWFRACDAHFFSLRVLMCQFPTGTYASAEMLIRVKSSLRFYVYVH
jgi:hypothetical protein